MAAKGDATAGRFQESQRYVGYSVRDNSGGAVGEAGAALTADGGSRYLEVRQGSDSRLVVWELLNIDDSAQLIVVAAAKNQIDGAPPFDRSTGLTDEIQRAIRAHFGVEEGARGRAADDVVSSAPAAAGAVGGTSPRAALGNASVSGDLGSEDPEIFSLGSRSGAAWRPAYDVVQGPRDYRIVVDLPGVDGSAIEIRVQDDVLVVAGERGRVDGGDYHRSERPFGRFVQRFRLPEGTDPEAIDAQIADGVLELRVPSPAPRRSRTIALRQGQR